MELNHPNSNSTKNINKFRSNTDDDKSRGDYGTKSLKPLVSLIHIMLSFFHIGIQQKARQKLVKFNLQQEYLV